MKLSESSRPRRPSPEQSPLGDAKSARSSTRTVAVSSRERLQTPGGPSSSRLPSKRSASAGSSKVNEWLARLPPAAPIERLPEVPVVDVSASLGADAPPRSARAKSTPASKSAGTAGARTRQEGEPLEFDMSSWMEVGLPTNGCRHRGLSANDWVQERQPEVHFGTFAGHPTFLQLVTEANFPEINRVFSGDEKYRPTDRQIRDAMSHWLSTKFDEFNAPEKVVMPEVENLSAMLRELTRREPAPAPRASETNFEVPAGCQLTSWQAAHLEAFRNDGPGAEVVEQFAFLITALMSGVPILLLLKDIDPRHPSDLLELAYAPPVKDGVVSYQPDLILAIDGRRCRPVFKPARQPEKKTIVSDGGFISHLGMSLSEAVGAEIDVGTSSADGNCLFDSLAQLPHIQAALKAAPAVENRHRAERRHGHGHGHFLSFAKAAGSRRRREISDATRVRRELVRRLIEWLGERDRTRSSASQSGQPAVPTPGEAAPHDPAEHAIDEFLAELMGEAEPQRRGNPNKSLGVSKWEGSDLEKTFQTFNRVRQNNILDLLTENEFDFGSVDVVPQLVAKLFNCELRVLCPTSKVESGREIPGFTESRSGAAFADGSPRRPVGHLLLDDAHYRPILLKSPQPAEHA